MTFASAVFVVLWSFAIPSVDRDEPDRANRLGVMALSIARAANHATCADDWDLQSCKRIARDRKQVAAELAVLADHETGLASNVHRGECGRYECGSTLKLVKGQLIVVHLARTPWQIEKAPAWSQDYWDSLLGDSQLATDTAAWQAAKFLAGYRGICGGTVGAFAGYATGSECSHPKAKQRANATAIVYRQLSVLMDQDALRLAA